MTVNLCARLERLERVSGSDAPVVIWQDHSELAEAAIARWRSARPGEPAPAAPTLIRWEAPSS